MTPAEQEKFNEVALDYFRDIGVSLDFELLSGEQELLWSTAYSYEIPLLDVVRYKMYEDIVIYLLKDIARFYGWKEVREVREVKFWNLDE